MTQYIAIPCDEDQGCEGCCFSRTEEVDGEGRTFDLCYRPDSVPHCQQTDDKCNSKEFIYEVKP